MVKLLAASAQAAGEALLHFPPVFLKASEMLANPGMGLEMEVLELLRRGGRSSLVLAPTKAPRSS